MALGFAELMFNQNFVFYLTSLAKYVFATGADCGSVGFSLHFIL